MDSATALAILLDAAEAHVRDLSELIGAVDESTDSSIRTEIREINEAADVVAGLHVVDTQT
jgi:hypothetical protein